jgi:plastocyanin/mono/diheme cytochrome c family protein
VGSVQRLATVVIVGLVALSSILFLYLGDEDSRITAKEDLHQEAAISRAMDNYIALCLQCHGPAGEGYTEPGVAGSGRVGAPLGGINTSLNQQGINARGTPVAGGVEARTQVLHDTIYHGLQNPDGTYRMPAFGGTAGSLTDEQINELVVFIQNVDWNLVYNESVDASGGYPTPPPAPATEVADAPAGDTTAPAEPAGESAGSVTVESHDIFFVPDMLEIPADTTVTLDLPNVGAAPHNFSIDELGIDVDIAPGETQEIQVNIPAGEYEFYCNVPGHREAGMVGTLVVSEDASLPGGEAAAASEGEAAPAEEPAADEGEPAAEDAAAADGSEAAEPVTVTSFDIFFEPAEVTIPANTDVTFVLPNEGAAPHNFAIDELDISIDQAPGETHEIVINAPPGEYEFYCNVPGHREAGMIGTLIVEG